ncbi:hypothetical protein OUZ56_008065 [Daphnia magna]|uniref:Uncharacterized protein n=1 Tax=Daphnia magna TaxID=35525 RepID=A0ABR0ABU6_9CRUS|nr:hypothetical protein OUZ56_008065 [Daphnia magna]
MNVFRCVQCQCHSATGKAKDWGAFYSDSIFLFTLFLDAGYIRQDLPNAVCSVQTKPDGDLLKDYLELVESRPPLGVLHQCHCSSGRRRRIFPHSPAHCRLLHGQPDGTSTQHQS